MDPIEENKKLNLSGQELFYNYLDEKEKKIIKEKFKKFIKDNHNTQWSQHIHNILSVKTNCKNDCKYCYMKRMKNKFFDVDLENFDVLLDEKKVTKKWKKVNNKTVAKMIMFPSSHDILIDYVDSYITSALHILDGGHSLLIVTKPRLDCIKKMVDAFVNYKDKIIFRLTITSKNDDILSYYETNASKYDERKECMIYLFEHGYRTSISMEPFLSDPKEVINDLKQYVTDDIWLGLMSGIKQSDTIDDEHKQQLNELYNNDNIMKLVNELKADKKIMWKTSVMRLLI
jgi:DNA repair photolyase